MAFTTHQGPLRVGPNHRATVAGGRNVGLVVLNQHYDTGDLTGTGTGNVDSGVVMTLPRGAIIVDIVIDQVVAATAGTTTVSVGTSAGGAQLMAAVATTAGGRFRGTATAATQLAWSTSTTADTSIHVRNVVGAAALTAGRFIVHVMYVQRADDGSVAPAA